MQVALQISKKHKKKDSSPHLLWFVFVTNHTDTDDLSSCVNCENVDDHIDQGCLRMVEWLTLMMRSLLYLNVKKLLQTNDLNLRYSLQTKGRAPTQLELLDLVTAKLDDQTILLLGRSRQNIEIHLVFCLPGPVKVQKFF